MYGKALTYQRVDDAIKSLVRKKEIINFNSVAIEAGISKATLYNHKELRVRIDLLRKQQGRTSATLKKKDDINENSKTAIIESLQRRIKKLEGENKQLRSQLKIAYSDVYKHI
ncbi:DUF6262 family protein [Robertmurraya beringensis]|uniref:DUF6262 family protein n=1 Tax=Robertmurraya beringensis TaxID=641660 RepID=A0ABV6KY93_9BACI